MNAPPAPSSAPFDGRLGLILFFAVLVLAIPQAALLPLLDRDEPRFAEASREMLQSGNFIVPTFDHAPRYAKPPLIYWCQVLSFTLFGENAFAARLPSLLATAGTAWLLFAWGSRLGTEQVGLGAALSYAFCFQAIQQGRVATADALLIFFMTLAVFAGWRMIAAAPESRDTRPYFWNMMLVLGFAGGFLAKGPEAFLPLIPLLICGWSVRRGLNLEIGINFILSLAIVLLWAIPAYIETHGDYWRVGLSEGVGERAITGLQGHGSSGIVSYLVFLPYYLVLFWLSALPWSPLLVSRRKVLFSGWKPDLLDKYLLLNIGLIFLVFTLMVTKLPHYTLPAFPLIALLFARRWKSSEFSPGTLTELGWVMGIGVALATVVIVPIAVANHCTPSPVGELVRQADGMLKSDTQFAVVDFQEPNATWEMRRVAKGYGQPISEGDVVNFLQQPGSRAVLLSMPAAQRINRLADPGWRTFEAKGFNAAKGNFIDLALIVKS